MDSDRNSVHQRTHWLLNSTDTTDVTFLVRNGIPGQVEHIRAHKAILAAGSDVFYRQFYGNMRPTAAVEVADTTPNAFKALIRYIYTDDFTTNVSDAAHVYFLAKKYLLPELQAKAAQFIHRMLNADNVLTFLPYIELMEEEEIALRCWMIVDFDTERLIKTMAFLDVPPETLRSFISREQLTVSEITLYKRVIDWAKAELMRNEAAVTPQAVRKLLGDVFYEIRFAEMTQEEFAEGPGADEYLSDQEKCQVTIFKIFSTKATPMPFKIGSRHNGWRLLNTCAEWDPHTAGNGVSLMD